MVATAEKQSLLELTNPYERLQRLHDLLDVELDRKHPKKRFRPLAAGELSEGAAKTIAPALAAWAPNLVFGAAAAYLLLTVRT